MSKKYYRMKPTLFILRSAFLFVDLERCFQQIVVLLTNAQYA